MNENAKNQHHGLASTLGEIGQELKEFVQTRIEMFKREFLEKFQLLKIAAPLAALAALLIATAYLLITMALVSLASVLLRDSPYHWCFAFLIVAFLWFVLGGIAGFIAKREVSLHGLMPQKSIEVLKGDKIWLQGEAQNQL